MDAVSGQVREDPSKSDSQRQLVVCHECDALHHRHDIPLGASARCMRCGHHLYQHHKQPLPTSLALYLSTFVFMIIANVYPFIAMSRAGLYEENRILSGGWALYQFGMGELGLVVFLTSIVFPFVAVVGMLYLLLPIYFAVKPPAMGVVYRLVRLCEPWSLMSVFMLGTLIAVVKLQSMASVIPGLGMAGFVLMLICYSAARSNFDPEIIWRMSEVKQKSVSEELTDFVACHICGLLADFDDRGSDCQRCGAALHHRLPESIQRTWALLISAAFMLIPANIYPVMTIKTFGKGHPDTILSGVEKLIDAGMWGLGFIVLFASLVIPILKLSALSYLLYSVQTRSNWRPRDRTLLYRVTELVGAWSMVDVFLVALLSSLVSLGLVATIEPGIGASFFAAAVILTILAARSFDPRLIWDGIDQE